MIQIKDDPTAIIKDLNSYNLLNSSSTVNSVKENFNSSTCTDRSSHHVNEIGRLRPVDQVYYFTP